MSFVNYLSAMPWGFRSQSVKAANDVDNAILCFFLQQLYGDHPYLTGSLTFELH
ncbi:MAG: hypothetical protein ACOYM1_12240 [Methylovulum sp.]